MESDLAKAKDEVKKVQTEKSKQEFAFNYENAKLKEENKALREQIARFEEERARLEDEIRQATVKGRRLADIEKAKFMAKSSIKVGTQTDREIGS